MERLTEEKTKYGSDVTKQPLKINKIKEKASRQSLKKKNEEGRQGGGNGGGGGGGGRREGYDVVEREG